MNRQQKKGLIEEAEEKTKKQKQKQPALNLWITTVYEMEGGGLEKHSAEIL